MAPDWIELGSVVVARTMRPAVFLERLPGGLRMVCRRDGKPDEATLLSWHPDSERRLSGTLSRAGVVLKKAAIIIPRDEVILLTLERDTGGSALKTIAAQLPAAMTDSAFVCGNGRLALWPKERQAETEAWCIEGGVQFNGALVADGVLSSSESDWLVRPRVWNAQRVLSAISGKERPAVALIALMLVAGIFCSRQADSTIGRNQQLTRARRQTERFRDTAPSQTLSLLAGLTHLIPQNAHLLELSINESTRDVRLRGRATDYSAVWALTNTLSSDRRLSNVHPGRAGLAKVGGHTVVDFSLEARLR